MGYSESLWEVASSQHGVFTSLDAEEAGVPGVELRKMSARGTLEKVARGVYRHPRVPLDNLTDVAGVVAALGPGAHLEWDSVLAVNGLANVDPPYIHVGLARSTTRTIPANARVSRRRPLRHHNPGPDGMGLGVKPLSADDISHHEGIAALTVHRALLDAMGRVPTDRLDVALDEATTRGLLDRREHAHINWLLVNVHDGLVHVPFQQIEMTGTGHDDD